MNTHKDFVADSIAMDKAWLAGTFDQWLNRKRKEVFDELRDDEDGVMAGETASELDADASSLRGDDAG